MTPPSQFTTVTLRALQGQPLADDAIRSTVVATAHAIAERTGVPLIHIETAPDKLTVVLHADRIAAVGFAAELRRLTENWRRKHDNQSLWGESPNLKDSSDDDWWKRGDPPPDLANP
ncbi:MAG: hypothetical protein VYC34_10570 [Planctomycetota bacterium]|nr:hypothetical protein [Planctomycetota bacterium]